MGDVTVYRPTHIVKIDIGTATALEKIIRVRQGIGTSEGGDLIKPITVANTVAPIGALDPHKWWEILIDMDQDDQEALFETSYISPTTGTPKVTTLGASTAFTLKIYEKHVMAAGTVKTRDITYTLTHVQRRENEVENMRSTYQPHTVRFLSYGTRSVSIWGSI